MRCLVENNKEQYANGWDQVTITRVEELRDIYPKGDTY